MTRFVWLAAAGILGSATLLLVVGGRWDGSAAPAAAAAKGLSVADLMLVIHDGKGLLGQVRQSVRGAGPADDKAWKSVQARTAVMVSLVESILVPAMPAKGDKASWKQKTTAYLSAVKALAAAAVKEDASGAYETTAKLLKSCTPCHDAHQ
jgi:cytochrome c556